LFDVGVLVAFPLFVPFLSFLVFFFPFLVFFSPHLGKAPCLRGCLSVLSLFVHFAVSGVLKVSLCFSRFYCRFYRCSVVLCCCYMCCCFGHCIFMGGFLFSLAVLAVSIVCFFFFF